MSRRWPTLLAWLALLAGPGAWAQEDLQQALADELERSIRQLKLNAEQGPYFVEYRVEESRSLQLKASFGGISRRYRNRSRSGSVQVRVGDYKLDSSLVPRFGQAGTMHRYYPPNNFRLPLDDDYGAVRRAFWLATDLAYKRALEDYSVKLADTQVTVDRDGLVDFYSAEPAQVEELADPPPADEAALTELVVNLSNSLAAFDELHESAVWVSVVYRDVHYVNSEGSRFRRQVPDITWGAIARTQAPDGAVLWDFDRVRRRNLDQLPPAAELQERVQRLGQRLTEARSADRIDNYVGPVLFENQAAAVLFANVFATQLQSVPRMVASEPSVRPWIRDLQEREQRFGRKIGARVLPRGTQLVDDPTRDAFEGLPLVGTFAIDDEGVPARPKTLVDDGRLKQILSTRVPMFGTTESSGNNRGGFPMPGNLVLSSNVAADANERQLLLEELRIDAGTDYVLVIERLADSQAQRQLESMQSMAVFNYGNRLPEALVVWRVYPDGRRERVRNLSIEPFAVREFRRLEAVGDDPYVHSVTPPFPSGGVFLTGVRGRLEPVSYVVPSLLFEELSVADSKVMDQRPPVLSRPE
ncbi:MAG: metallopeptidase TldD-related protein [Pseudomonadota bacterium]